jgi:hypothetical protein
MEAVDGDYDEPYHCDYVENDSDACEACIIGSCAQGSGHCVGCNDPEDDAGCVHCGCCSCTPCEYARVA